MIHYVTQVREPLSVPILTTTATDRRQQYDRELPPTQSINYSSPSPPQIQTNEKQQQQFLSIEEEAHQQQHQKAKEEVLKSVPLSKVKPNSYVESPPSLPHRRNKKLLSIFLDKDGDPSSAFWFGT